MGHFVLEAERTGLVFLLFFFFLSVLCISDLCAFFSFSLFPLFLPFLFLFVEHGSGFNRSDDFTAFRSGIA